MTRVAVTGIIGAARLGGAAARGSAVLAGRLAAEAVDVLLPSSGSGDLDRGGFRGPSERGLVEEPLQAPIAPQEPQARPRPRRPPSRAWTAAPGSAVGGTVADDGRGPGRVAPFRGGTARGATAAPPPGPSPAQAPSPPPAPSPPAPRRASSRPPAAPHRQRPRARASGQSRRRAPGNGAGAGPSAAPTADEARAAEESQPAHVSEETQLAAQFADPGAEDGAGAQVRIEQPWSGYGKLKAREVVDRLVAEPDAAVSLVLLYERANRRRRSVLEAAERELVRRSPPDGRT